jgi:formate C-acetyltransferase
MTEYAWRNFKKGLWTESINVADFITNNYTPYAGNEEFLSGLSNRTAQLWNECMELIKAEASKGGVLDIDTETISGITGFAPGYINKDLELIVGLQTDRPLKRSVVPYGGIRIAKKACESYGYQLDNKITAIYQNYSKTHNDGVFDVYTPEMKKARKSGVITGLPDSYGRGRIIGDYRRVALYGIDKLIEEKNRDKDLLNSKGISEEKIKLREEIAEQVKALNELLELGLIYGYDLSKPASSSIEAIQWTYLAFLGSIKETNGAANSLGRASTFFDIYIERDINEGTLTEEQAQELIDQFIIKLRFVRHLRTPEYNELFAGDPVWITESIGGIAKNGKHMVTKTSYRFLQTLYNLGPAPEPNLTILWSEKLPVNFKRFCSQVSIDTCAVQFENDDLMRLDFGDDYGISCCVSAMKIGKNMQYFGARCNMPKLLLLALNGGKDEITGEQVAPPFEPYTGDILEYESVLKLFRAVQEWLTGLYVDTMNIIHYMHDKYAYERLMMALHDTDVERLMAFGIAGLSVLADSLSAIKYSKVRAIRNPDGLITDFETYGEYPHFGNDDDRVDTIAVKIIEDFYKSLETHKTYRNARHTLSVLTITSNVVYGSKTGSTPDGRKKGQPFAPGANPMHGREKNGILAAMNSLTKLPYKYCRDGISYTMSVLPQALGKSKDIQINNLVGMLDGYFIQGGHHINVNVLDRIILEEAMEDPSKYPQLTVRVSGYAVNFNRLSRKQQDEVIKRTFHKAV